MKEQNVHEDCGIFVHVWTDCMNYLKYILVNDISTESIEVEKKNITFFFFWAPTHLHEVFIFLRVSPFFFFPHVDGKSC